MARLAAQVCSHCPASYRGQPHNHSSTLATRIFMSERSAIQAESALQRAWTLSSRLLDCLSQQSHLHSHSTQSAVLHWLVSSCPDHLKCQAGNDAIKVVSSIPERIQSLCNVFRSLICGRISAWASMSAAREASWSHRFQARRVLRAPQMWGQQR